ncbi:GNAT family N-acetyltransferase [Candidatus Binatia bacterium]|jgi:GNAT superfamily N-acetyltransferase|nr:GNAT family N-acetyltransferase [Candidatus Binatia bacterium]
MTDVRVAVEQPSRADLDVIHATLAATYWSPGVPREVVERGCANAICAIARDADGALVGFGRVISDRASFAWLCDVFVLPAAQGRGVARALVGTLRAHPELQGLRRWLLATRDAHGVYAPLGFAPLAAPERWMEIFELTPHRRDA